MKKLLALALAFSAQAGALTWKDILTPGKDVLQAACATGTRIEGMPATDDAQRAAQDAAYNEAAKNPLRTGVSLTDARTFKQLTGAEALLALLHDITLSTPTRTSYLLCGNAAAQLQAPPAAALEPVIMVTVGADVRQLSDAERHNAVLVLLNSSGNEIVRLTPVTAYKGLAKDWETSCATSDGSCVWRGRNRYIFATRPLSAAQVAQVAKLRLLVNRGQGIEQRDYGLDDFLKGKLTDPRP